MNLKDWEKILEKKDVIIMRHPKGHQMTIALKALPKIQQEQMKRLPLAKGGEVESEQGKTVRRANKMKNRGDDQEYKQEMSEAKEEAKGRASFEKVIKPKMMGLAEGGEVDQEDKGAVPTDQVMQDKPQQPITINVGQAASPSNPNTYPGASVMPPTPPPAVPQAPPPVELSQPEPVTGSSLRNESQKTLQSIGDANTAIQDQAKLEAAKSQAQIPIVEQQLQKEQVIADKIQDSDKMVNWATNKYSQYMNEHPEDIYHWQKNLSTPEKVTTAIGLILGGFGDQNVGMNFVQSQINRDLEAQRHNKQDQQNVLGAYQQLFGYNKISTELARASLNEMAAKQTQLQALRMGTPQAQINAKLAGAKFMMESQDARNKAASLLGNARMNGGKVEGGGTLPSKRPDGSPGGKKSQQENPNVYHILTPGARNAVDMARLHPVYGAQADKMDTEFQQAQQAEKVLNGPKNDGAGGIHDLLQTMHQAAGGGSNDTQAGWEHVRRNVGDALNRIPWVGPEAKKVIDLSHKSSNFQNYEQAEQAIKTDLATALQGLLTPSSIEDLTANMPQYRDTREDVARKEKYIVNAILKAVRTPNLGKIGALK